MKTASVSGIPLQAAERYALKRTAGLIRLFRISVQASGMTRRIRCLRSVKTAAAEFLIICLPIKTRYRAALINATEKEALFGF